MRFMRFASVVCLFALVPATAWAQAAGTGTLAGAVRDTSGALIPGVIIEAASPALIERVRTATSDGQGQYRIIDLRSGPYTVTFTLPGFKTLIRDGIELTTGSTVTVSAELTVGGVEEAITVTGSAPVVDVRGVRQQAVISSETLDSIPGGRNMGAIGRLLVGASGGGNVSGAAGEGGAGSIHGTGNGQTTVDGMRMEAVFGGGTGTRMNNNSLNTAEFVL